MPRAPRGSWPCLALLAAALPCGCFQDAPIVAGTDASSSTSTTTSTSTTVAMTSTTTASTATTTSTTATAAGESTTGESSGACEPVLWYPDVDGDTYGDPEAASVAACEAPPDHVDNDLDCDDDAAGVNPEADELCDGVDNDCDQAIDEYSPANLECGGCTMVAAGRSVYHLCPAPLPWENARALCQGRGGDLVILADPGEDALVGELIAGTTTNWWLGLSDLALEGSFVWVDDAPLDPKIAAWQVGEPNNLNEEDCAERYPTGFWNDAKCALARPTICESPAP
ncbi:MAG: hypothetical protein H6710_12685 [Myxococcales bacterium]|nr:hypothetical protein [Myxococcales bacterium]